MGEGEIECWTCPVRGRLIQDFLGGVGTSTTPGSNSEALTELIQIVCALSGSPADLFVGD